MAAAETFAPRSDTLSTGCVKGTPTSGLDMWGLHGGHSSISVGVPYRHGAWVGRWHACVHAAGHSRWMFIVRDVQPPIK